MMKKINTFKIFYTAALFLLLATSAKAVTVLEYDKGLGYAPRIQQYLPTGEFSITNDSGETLYAFVVANSSAYNSWSDNSVNSLDWSSSIVDAGFWNSSGIRLWGDVYTGQLGSFDVLFPGYNKAFIYYYDPGRSGYTNPVGIDSGGSASGFNFMARQPGSPYIVIGETGIVASGMAVHVDPVPLPAAVWLFGFGLGALSLVTRRRRV